jgi:hypothetical protein
MKILLDECLPLDFRHSFPNHDAHTTQWAGLKSKKNGELLLAAEASPLVFAGARTHVTMPSHRVFLRCITNIIEKDASGFHAWCPELKACQSHKIDVQRTSLSSCSAG